MAPVIADGHVILMVTEFLLPSKVIAVKKMSCMRIDLGCPFCGQTLPAVTQL